jgi:hypothetical protein
MQSVHCLKYNSVAVSSSISLYPGNLLACTILLNSARCAHAKASRDDRIDVHIAYRKMIENVFDRCSAQTVRPRIIEKETRFRYSDAKFDPSKPYI